jgi:hypothetical protein
MKPLQMLLVAMAVSVSGVLSAASAMPVAPLGVERQEVHQARVMCDEYGRCFRTEPREYGYRNKPCPEGYTVQGGVCKPYLGPHDRPTYGYREKPCPDGYTLQSGYCKPYAGPHTYYR